MSPPGAFTLPGRALDEEDAWVRALQAASDAEVLEATRAAVRAGRPGLAGRAVSLVLSDAAVAGDPELERAARAARLLLSRPDPARHGGRLAALAPRLRSAWQESRHARAADLARLRDGLAHLNPRAVMARGYSIVANRRGEIVRDSRNLEPGEEIAVLFHRGRADAAVLSTDHDDSMPLAGGGIASRPGAD